MTKTGDFSTPQQLSVSPAGGYRPQIAVGAQDALHVLFYDRSDGGDIIRHRVGPDWSAPAQVGFDEDRNWGPDLVARADGSVVMVFDHALPSFVSRGWLSEWNGAWSEPVPLTDDDPQGEIGSGHVAHGTGQDLAYVWIGKKMDPQQRFVARGMWRQGGQWSQPTAFTDGTEDAWHTNVERRPDGSVLVGYDVGTGGGETTLYLVNGADGRFGTPDPIGTGERPHFAFGDEDHVTWFHKIDGRPIAVKVVSGQPGDWSAPAEVSEGYGGFHFDPDIAINDDGVRCLVWGWDAGKEAELVYSLDRGSGWEEPRKVASLGQGKPGLPSIDVDSQGAFHVVWNQGVRGDSHVYYAALRP